MAFVLQALTSDDGPQCVDIYFAAFRNPHSVACWPRTPTLRAWWEHMIREEIDEPGAHWLKAVTRETGETAGFVKWQEPKPGVEPDTNLPAWPEGADKVLCDETFGEWARKHRELLGRRGHWCESPHDGCALAHLWGFALIYIDLELVATDPAYQGQGAGSQMIAWGLQQADMQGVEAYLEGSPDAVILYQKFGFEEIGRTDTFIDNERVANTSYRTLYMFRAARKGEIP